MKTKVPKPPLVEQALELAGFKLVGHPTVMWPYIVIECHLDEVPGGRQENLEERAVPALALWREHGVSWNQVGKRLLIFLKQERRIGRPAGPEKAIEAKAEGETALRDAGLTYQQIREKLYPDEFVELDAIKQRVRRYKLRKSRNSQ